MSSRNWPSLLALRVRAARERARESLFVLPALIVVFGIVAAEGINHLDRQLDEASFPDVLQMSRDAAITLLGTVAGATITTAGVVFSIMVVSVQLASGQFSPRVVRGFYRDRLAQSVIGLLVAAFTFSVITLQQMHAQTSASSTANVPIIAIDITALVALIAVFAIVAFLDRAARGLYVGTVADRVADESMRTLEIMCDHDLRPATRALGDADVEKLGRPHFVHAEHDGWVQQISGSAVLAAVRAGTVVRLETRVGGFVTAGQTIASVWPAPLDASSVDRGVRDALVIGERRTMQQDADFGLRQLNDIALRALSPAVNDPTTAIEVVLRVSTVLRRILLSDLPPQASEDTHGSVLLTPWDLDHAEYVGHAYDQVRLVATPHPAVAVAMLRSMRLLIAQVTRAGFPERAEPLHRQMRLLLAGVEAAGLLPEDLASVHAAAAPGRVERLLALETDAGGIRTSRG